MTEKTFDELWNWVNARGSIATIQECTELEHVYNLMKSCACKTYLEVGSAEGNSLYILGHATEEISYIDYGEMHTEMARLEAVKALGRPTIAYIGDSTEPETFFKGLHHDRYDCVLIDGGHDYSTVLSDSLMYAPLATKYVFWHDIQLPTVKPAYEWFKKRWKIGEYSEFINSDTFGFGICKII